MIKNTFMEVEGLELGHRLTCGSKTTKGLGPWFGADETESVARLCSRARQLVFQLSSRQMLGSTNAPNACLNANVSDDNRHRYPRH